MIISLIHFYQRMPLASHGACHFYPSCSNYMIEAIENYGVIKGMYKGIRRLLRCHPGATFGYDPVQIEKGKNRYEKETN